MFDAVNVNRLTLWLGLGKLVHERCSSEDLRQRSQTNERQTPDEKIRILRPADGERTIREICAENNISEQTFHRWKKEFGLLDVKQAKRLKELEAENTRLKRIVADQVPGMEIIQEALEKTGHKRQEAEGLVAWVRCSGRKVCRYLKLHRPTYRYAAKEPNAWKKRLRAAVRRYSLKNRKWGYVKITRLLKNGGFEYDGPKCYLGFAPWISPQDFRAAFTAAEGWGTLTQQQDDATQTNSVAVKWGRVKVKTLAVQLPDRTTARGAVVAVSGHTLDSRAQQDGLRLRIIMPETVELGTADVMLVKIPLSS